MTSGANLKALTFAREALQHVGEVANIERFDALRVLGLAMMTEGRLGAATDVLEGAIAVAISLGALEDAADLLRQLGCVEIDRKEVLSAEHRFRTAIDLLKLRRSELVASLHHNLAIALFMQGKEVAEIYANMALALRPDKRSASAQQDLELLGSIRSGRGLAS